ncbi:putative exonuclease [Pantoea phage vB_PagM_AAM22]|nr:putative exonuclease [Pantoea phage vB_PagM_AAM22]
MTTPQLPKASDALQWMECHGSHAAQQLHPGTPGELSQSRLEGRAAHEVAQKLFRNEPFRDIVGSLSQDGIVITQELFEAAREYYNDVWGYCNSHGIPREQIQVEKAVSLEHHLPGWFGIPDVSVRNTTLNHLVIWDGKFGHSLVEVYEHWPMILYAGALIQNGEGFEPEIIEFRIVQPRGFHSEGTVRKWCLTMDELAHYLTQIDEALKGVMSDSPVCTPGPQCKTCTARAGCDALQRTSYDNIDYVNSLSTHTLSGHSLGVELKLLQRAQEMIKMRLSGLEEQALHEIKQGHHVPYFAVKPKYGHKRWKKEIPVEQVIMMGDIMGKDLRKPVELDTPAQCIKKGIDPAVVEQYAETPSTGVKLEPVTERGIKSVFSR